MNIEKVFQDYRGKVLSYLTSKVGDGYLAEDLCQDVFLKVTENAASFDETKASVSTWIYTITRHTLIDYYRSRRVMPEVPETLADDEDVEDNVINGMALEKLAAALRKMDKRMRDVIILRYYDGKSLREIGEAMGVSYAYVKVLQNKALAFLKIFLENV